MGKLKSCIKCVWDNKRLIFVFCFTMLTLVFFAFSRNIIDSIWNYGFSYAISKGQVPYRDFTMIIPPLYNLVMSLGLYISSNNLMFLVEQAIMVTVLFYLLHKMYKDNAWIFLAVMCFPFFVAFCPTYNFFLFFLFVIILYLEKNTRNDFLIGIFLACMVLTKYTVGVFFLIPSVILYFKERKRLLKRILGFVIPCLLFLIYLLVTKSFVQFFDLCVFGLFDFAKSNTILFTPLFFVSAIFFLISLFCVIKDKKNILNWYVLFSFSVMLPIFTRYHFYVYTMFFSLLFISKNLKVNDKYIRNISLFICLITVIFNFFFTGAYKRIERFSDVNNFEYYFTLKGSKKAFSQADLLYDKYKKKGNVIVLATNTAFLKVANGDEFTYFTVLNKGNFGFNGTNKMIERVKKSHNCYFMIFKDDYWFAKEDKVFHYEKSQFDYEIVDYIIDNGVFVEEKDGYWVYYVE